MKLLSRFRNTTGSRSRSRPRPRGLRFEALEQRALMTAVSGNAPPDNPYTPPAEEPFAEVGSAVAGQAAEKTTAFPDKECGQPVNMAATGFVPVLVTESFYFKESVLPSGLSPPLTQDLDDVIVHESWTENYSAEGGPEAVEISVGGHFNFDAPSQYDMYMEMVSNTEDGSYSPYLLEMELQIGNIPFSGFLKITVTIPPTNFNPGFECVFNTEVTGTLENVTAVVEIMPPHVTDTYSYNHFYVRDDVGLSFTTDVDEFQMTFEMREDLIAGLSLVPPFSLLGLGFAQKAAADFVEDIQGDLSEKFEGEMEDAIHDKATTELTSKIQNEPGLADLIDLLDGSFWKAAEQQTDMITSEEDADKVVICSTVYLAAEDRVFYTITPIFETEEEQEPTLVDPGDPYGLGKLLYVYQKQLELLNQRDPEAILELIPRLLYC